VFADPHPFLRKLAGGVAVPVLAKSWHELLCGELFDRLLRLCTGKLSGLSISLYSRESSSIPPAIATIGRAGVAATITMHSLATMLAGDWSEEAGC